MTTHKFETLQKAVQRLKDESRNDNQWLAILGEVYDVGHEDGYINAQELRWIEEHNVVKTR